MFLELSTKGKQQTVTQVVYTRNLKLTSDYLLTQVGQVVGSLSGSKAEAGSSASGEHHKDLKHVVGDSDSADVKVEGKWKSLLAE